MSDRTYTIEQIKHANARAGLHWFDPDTLRFFGSKIGRTTYQRNGRTFFVSSERSGFDLDAPRRHSVREFKPETGEITTVGEFLAYETGREAVAAIKRGEFDDVR